ncbi:hypothetical protein [Aliiroseovarius subalbicans]|uniref:hypothetical protein n=1 Tax=Aliiroseovarius subalbicans TaxID=2925840 RepID=UPI001F5AA044|nr:hypothetical protein [Aliiroseovarius subalbicans]MCI2398518.1 hypothetical protein [Aliiroseovarius subalbicans]
MKQAIYVIGGGLIGWGIGSVLDPALGWVIALMGAAIGLWMVRGGRGGTSHSETWNGQDDDSEGGWFSGTDDGGDAGGDD